MVLGDGSSLYLAIGHFDSIECRNVIFEDGFDVSVKITGFGPEEDLAIHDVEIFMPIFLQGLVLQHVFFHHLKNVLVRFPLEAFIILV